MERYFLTAYWIVFLWGIAVILGFVGLGRLVARVVGGESAQNAGWGLHAVWGMSAYLFVGGGLSLFGACGEAAITLLIGLGVAAMIWTTYRRGLPKRADFAAIPWGAWPVFAIVALKYAGGLCWQADLNDADDLPAYVNFCEKLLASGSFADPFSWRRLASLGGHTLLQSSVLAHASIFYAEALEVAVCPVILLGLILGFRGGTLGRSRVGVFVALIAVTTPIIRVNSASYLTGVVLFLGLFVSLDLVERAEARRLRLLTVAGLVAGGFCSLRAQYIPAAGAALGLFWLASWLKIRSSPRAALIEAGCLGAGLLGAMLPWMIACWRSNGSPLFPLFQGNANPLFIPLAPFQSLIDRLALPIQMMVTPSLLPLLLCLLAAPEWRRGFAARLVSWAAVLASLALAFSIPFETVPRYVQPMLLTGAIAVLMAAAVTPRARVMAWVFGALVLATSLPERGVNLRRHYETLAGARKMFMPFRLSVIADYREAQLLVPEGSRILVCSDFPVLFDHARNPIWIIDMPNAASPAPGLPFHKPPEETKRYLHSLGVDYVIFMDFAQSRALYNRGDWQENGNGKNPLWKIQSPFYLDFFDTVDRLAASETTLGRKGNLTVIQFKP